MEGNYRMRKKVRADLRTHHTRAREVTVLVDPNMVIALSLSQGLAQRPLPLPAALVDVQPRATFVLQIESRCSSTPTGSRSGRVRRHLRTIAQRAPA